MCMDQGGTEVCICVWVREELRCVHVLWIREELRCVHVYGSKRY